MFWYSKVMVNNSGNLDGFEYSSITYPPLASFISVVILLTFNEKGEILAIQNPRGWDFPGGHVEQGEAPEDALHREAFEEACERIRTIIPFASARTSKVIGPYAGKYIIFYFAKLKQVLPFLSKYETTARKFVGTDQFLEIYGGGAPNLAREILQLELNIRASDRHN